MLYGFFGEIHHTVCTQKVKETGPKEILKRLSFLWQLAKCFSRFTISKTCFVILLCWQWLNTFCNNLNRFTIFSVFAIYIHYILCVLKYLCGIRTFSNLFLSHIVSVTDSIFQHSSFPAGPVTKLGLCILGCKLELGW